MRGLTVCAVQYMDTVVAKLIISGGVPIVQLNSGGYRSVTTKGRINDFLMNMQREHGLSLGRVWQDDWMWYYYLPYGPWHKRKDFYDGMMIRPDFLESNTEAVYH